MLIPATGPSDRGSRDNAEFASSPGGATEPHRGTAPSFAAPRLAINDGALVPRADARGYTPIRSAAIRPLAEPPSLLSDSAREAATSGAASGAALQFTLDAAR